MGHSRKKSFWEVLKDRVCSLEPLIRAVFSISLALIVLLFVSLTVVGPSSATFVIVVLDLVGLVVIAAMTGVLLHVCGFEP